jgi:hypothetical protein
MPDSDYDIDEIPAYDAIRQTCILFHASLKKYTAEESQYGNNFLDLKHFDAALRKTLTDMNRHNRSLTDLFQAIVGDLLLIVSGLFIAPVIVSLLVWINASILTRGVFSPTGIDILATVFGISLVVIKWFMANK